MSFLSLKATTEDDCDLISTLFQDSILHFQYHFWDENSKSFHLMLNRFCWEDFSKFEEYRCYFRVHSGLYIHNVTSIKVNRTFRNNKHKFLYLLAIHARDNEINILFADNKHICIKVSDLLIYSQDLHDKYPTPSIPELHYKAA